MRKYLGTLCLAASIAIAMPTAVAAAPPNAAGSTSNSLNNAFTVATVSHSTTLKMSSIDLRAGNDTASMLSATAKPLATTFDRNGQGRDNITYLNLDRGLATIN